jgi:V/A-type H+-transporting ATPase subunit E
MSLDHIRETILAEARAEGERIVATAHEHKEQRLAAARESLEGEFARRREQAEQEQRQRADRQVVARRAEHNLALLKQRNEILDELFDRAADRLADLPDEEYCAVVGEWMRGLPDDVGGTVLCNERDRERLAGLVARLNEGRPDGAQLRIEQCRRPLRGGVLFQTENYEIDLSVDSRLKRLRETLAPELARLVFPDEVTV